MQKIVSGFIAAALMTSLAHADADCVAHPKSEWLKEETLRAALAAEGYKIKVFKVDGNCYEMYGHNKDGKRVEIYFDTQTGKPVKAVME